MNYSIKKNELGSSFELNYPLLSFDDAYWMLQELNRCDTNYIIDEVLPNLAKVMSGEMQEYEFGYDSTIIDFYKEKSIINYNFFEDKIEVPSEDLYRFMKEWGDYLIKWKIINDNKITGLTLFNEKGESRTIGIGLGVNYFPVQKKDTEGWITIDSLPGNIAEIRWKYEGKEVSIKAEKNISIVYPSADLHYLVIIYYQEGQPYAAPANAVIYRGDGTIHKVLSPPPFKSSLLIEKLAFRKLPNPPLNLGYEGALWFNHVCWRKNEKGELVTVIEIGFDREWMEYRELNPETGEFGECLSSSRL